MSWFKKAIEAGKIKGLFIYAQNKAKKRAKKTGLIWHVVFLGNEFIEVEEHYFKKIDHKMEKSLFNTDNNKVKFAKIRALFLK